MDSLRFVLEAPQLSQTHKKRPRLVTSCDNWSVTRPVSLSLFRATSGARLTRPPSLPFRIAQPSEENKVCSAQVPASLRGVRGRQHLLPVPRPGALLCRA